MRKTPASAIIVSGLLLALLFAIVGASARSPGDIKVTLNETPLALDVSPTMVDGRVLVPLRSVFEALGARVTWDEPAKTVTATRGPTTIKATINEKTATKNGQALALDVPPVLINGRTMVSTGFVNEALGVTIEWNEKTRTVAIDGLPVVGSYENLKALLANSESQDLFSHRAAAGAVPLPEEAVPQQAEAVPQQAEAKKEAAPLTNSPAGRAGASDYSATNVQVQGVDEADVVKTDGEYLYQVNNQRIIIARAYPAETMKIESVVSFEGDNFTPRELYVDGKYLVVIGSSYNRIPLPGTGPGVIPEPRPQKPGEVNPMVAPKIYPPIHARSTTRVIVYDVSDKANVKRVREAELEGNYVSSRKIGPALYFVANKFVNYYLLRQGLGMPGPGAGAENPTPSYRDSAGTGEFTPISYQDIRYFPDHVEPNYLMVAGINLEEPKTEMKVATYLGAGQNVYVSQDNLYVTMAQYVPVEASAPGVQFKAPATSKPAIIGMPPQVNTAIYKFSLDRGTVHYRGRGEVPGAVLNQFSMDEYKGYFRIATTRGQIWRTDEYTSKNNLYVLDGALQLAGKIEDIAPGERIYSVRFMGDRGYMVTFKTVDPLFVLDLKDPRAPKILGKLKIPGYSDYLHPYDENHIIGFGKDTIEMSPGWQGKNAPSMAFYQGMKVAVFDVTDVEHPVEMFKEIIGDRGTDSELLRNHKALLFDKDKNLLAFPVTVMEVKNKTGEPTGTPQYGQFTFQGAYVYSLDLVNGFKLRGRITHLTDDAYLKSGNGWYQGNRNVERILYIGDGLYTLSKGMIKVNDLKTLEERNSLLIP